MKIGIPVAFLVSDPRLCATRLARTVSIYSHGTMEAKRTPGDSDPNRSVRSTCNAECREIASVNILGVEQDSVCRQMTEMKKEPDN